MIFLLVLEGANIYLVRVNPCPPVANLRGVCKRASGGVFEITPSTPPPGSGLGGGGCACHCQAFIPPVHPGCHPVAYTYTGGMYRY